MKTITAIDPLVTMPISRTNVAGAKTFLAWLAASPCCYHIEVSPADCILDDGSPSFSPELAALLDARVEECFTALGYSGAWDAFPVAGIADPDAATPEKKEYRSIVVKNGKSVFDVPFSDFFEDDAAAEAGLRRIMADRGYNVTAVRIRSVSEVEIA